jgi:hypothetical protein
MSLEWYSIQIQTWDVTLGAGAVIFNGFFSVDPATHIVQTFFDSTNPTVDIRSTGSNGGPTYLYYPGWLCFDGGGCNVTSFPYLYGATSGDYNMYGSTNASQGSIDEVSVYYTFASISGPLVCFNFDTKILTDSGYRAIQDLRVGDLVQTVAHGLKPIAMIGYRPIQHVPVAERIKDQLYICRPENYPELNDKLIMTGCHSILVKEFKEGQREKTQEILGDIYVTDEHYRLPACVDTRAEVYTKEGSYIIFHLALENDDYYMNYGIYANGLLVETTSKRYLKELSKMTLIE